MKSRTASLAVRLLSGAGFIVLEGMNLPAAAAGVPQGPGSLSGFWVNAHYLGTGQASD